MTGDGTTAEGSAALAMPATPTPALVLHASIDEAFVRGYLVPALGGEATAAGG